MIDSDELTEEIELAPAKINLFLHVNHRRDDGYHDLESLVVFTEFGDTVRLVPAPSLTLSRTGPFAAHLPDNPHDDLCVRAATELAGAFGRDQSVQISLEKNIPVAAGVGGGSADAAAVLRGLCRLWGLDAADPAVVEIAEGLGADVPVCLYGYSALIRGVGDVVEPIKDAARLELLLVNPNIPLSTAPVFRSWADATGPDTHGQESARTFESTSFPHALADTRNDLTVPAIGLCPAVGDVLAALEELPGCQLARMSGSGPTCFAIFETRAACEQASRALAQMRPGWWVCPTATRTVTALSVQI